MKAKTGLHGRSIFIDEHGDTSETRFLEVEAREDLQAEWLDCKTCESFNHRDSYCHNCGQCKDCCECAGKAK